MFGLCHKLIVLIALILHHISDRQEINKNLLFVIVLELALNLEKVLLQIEFRGRNSHPFFEFLHRLNELFLPVLEWLFERLPEPDLVLELL